MWSGRQWRAFEAQGWVQTVELLLGILLMLVAPVAGAIPGPGGIFVFAAGLALVLRTSMWAKRRYVRFKRWQPKAGRWADWGLRRKSARRREAVRKQRSQLDCPPPRDQPREGTVAAVIPGPPANKPEMPGDREPAD